MSVFIFRHNSEGKWPLILAANHDAVKNRISSGVKVLNNAPLVIGDQDAKHGGTWLAMAQSGLCVGCINREFMADHDVSRLSRGALVLKLAQFTGAAAAADYLQSLALKSVNSCYLLLADRQQLFCALVTDSQIKIVELTDNHWHVLGNLGLDAKEDPKTARARYLIHVSGMSDNSDYIGQLKPILRDHATPIMALGKKPLTTNAICFHSAEYSTKTAAILRLGQNDVLEYLASAEPLCCGRMENYSALLRK